jgi:hypothetical protein
LRNTWKPIWYTNDLIGMLQADRAQASRAMDQETAERLGPATSEPQVVAAHLSASSEGRREQGVGINW